MSTNKFLHNEQGGMSAINASIVVVLSSILLYIAVLAIGIVNDIPQIATTAGSVLVVLTPLLILLYIFRHEEKRKRTWG